MRLRTVELNWFKSIYYCYL